MCTLVGMARAEGVPTYTMRQLAAFVSVAETGTIAGAAERLHVSQSALSTAITDLEKALNAQLCVRRRAHGVRLTPTGQSVLARARILLQQANEIQADASGASGGVVGPVIVGCYPSLGPTVLPALLRGFTQRHPRATVEFREDNQDRLRTQVEDGELDVCIVYDLELSPQWRTEALMQRIPKVVLPAEHPLAHETSLRLADLAEEPMVLLDAPPSSSHALDTCRRAGFVPKIAYRTRNYETARAFVGQGLGWTLLVQRPALDVTYEGLPVVVVDVSVPVLDPVAIVIAWHQDALPSPVTRAFIEFALETYSSTKAN